MDSFSKSKFAFLGRFYPLLSLPPNLLLGILSLPTVSGTWYD